MDSTQLGIIALMKSAITGTAEPLPDGFDIEQAEELAEKQSVNTLVYVGAVNCGIPKTLPVMQRLFQKYIQLMLHSEAQMAGAKKLLQAFDDKGIDYLPLKGLNMKPLYPAPELRYMADADILIKPEQYGKIKDTMQELGYTMLAESGHEIVWKNAKLFVELHTQVNSHEDLDFIGFWGNGWKHAKHISNHRYSFSDELNFVFLFTHFAKHYREGGIGCRYVLDLWLYKQAFTAMDEQIIRETLARLSLLEFYENICNLLGAWFDSAAYNEKTEFISQYIFSGDSWGNWTNQVLSGEYRRSKKTAGKNRRTALFFRRLFPPYKTMLYQYPKLKKCPYLMPIFWVIRIFDVLLFQRHRVSKTMHAVEIATDENVQARYQALKYVGLDFNF